MKPHSCAHICAQECGFIAAYRMHHKVYTLQGDYTGNYWPGMYTTESKVIFADVDCIL